MILITCGTGKIGSRTTARLQALGLDVKPVSRSSSPAFDWDDQGTWAEAVKGADTAFIIFSPDLAIPGADELIRRFATMAIEAGTKRIVLLSGRGEPGAQLAEQALQAVAQHCTVLRASWFDQNFSEGAFLPGILEGELSLPIGDVLEPFVDTDDIADVAVAALTEDGHEGKVYELTGPRLLTFADAVSEISRATGRTIRFNTITAEEFETSLKELGLPSDYVELLMHLFTEVLDGRNASLSPDVERVLGRPARDFADYASAAADAWRAR